MTDPSDILAGRADPRSATAAPRRPAFWRALRRIAGVCTAGELGTLADHYQVGHPALSARFRSAAAVLSAQGRRA